MENMDLLRASTKLCLETYLRYKKFSLRAEQELALDTLTTDPMTNETCYSVRSTKYPEAPPRIFATADTRCSCKEHCTELDMCAHEIKVRGGFDEALFLPRHMVRECVCGSLHVTSPMRATANVDEMIGYQTESIECSLFSAMDISSRDNHDDEGMVCAIDHSISSPDNDEGMGHCNLISTVTTYEEPAPGYLPDTSWKVKPMCRKRFDQIFRTASQMYSGLGEDEQFHLTKIALDVQDFLTLRVDQSREAATRNGMTALIPTGNRLVKESKNRKKARNEVNAEVHTKKLKASVQRMGLSQTILGDQYDLQVNGKASARIHCSFCDGNHAVNSCTKRTDWISQQFHEYDLSTNNDSEAKLRSVLKLSMPTVTCAPESVFNKIERSLKSKNFIIRKAFHVKGKPTNQIESMNFCIDFLGKDGDIMDCSKDMWISGGLMNSIITHNNVKKKYVYDATTVHRMGMRQRDANIMKDDKNTRMDSDEKNSPDEEDNRSNNDSDDENLTLTQLGLRAMSYQ